MEINNNEVLTLEALIKRINDSKQQVDVLFAESQRLQQTIGSLLQEIKNRTGYLDDVNKKVLEKESLAKSLADEILTLSETRDGLKKDMPAIQAEALVIRSTAEKLRDEMNTLQGKLEGERQELEKEKADFKKEYATFKQAESELKEKHQRVKEFSQSI